MDSNGIWDFLEPKPERICPITTSSEFNNNNSMAERINDSEQSYCSLSTHQDQSGIPKSHWVLLDEGKNGFQPILCNSHKCKLCVGRRLPGEIIQPPANFENYVSIRSINEEICCSNFSKAEEKLKKETTDDIYEKCPKCEQFFKRKSRGLRRHIRIQHEGKKPYLCKLCNLAFKAKKHLDGHKMNVHLGQNTFDCQWCGLNFPKRSGLNMHSVHAHQKQL